MASVRRLSFFVEEKKYFPPFCFCFVSCCFTVRMPRFMSTQSQVSPRISPSRKPVKRVIL